MKAALGNRMEEANFFFLNDKFDSSQMVNICLFVFLFLFSDNVFFFKKKTNENTL